MFRYFIKLIAVNDSNILHSKAKIIGANCGGPHLRGPNTRLPKVITRFRWIDY